MVIERPEDFVSTQEFAQRNNIPVAFILPTTAAVRSAIHGGSGTERLSSIGNPQLGALHSPAAALNALRTSNERPALVVLTDQIIDQANTPILVKSTQGEHYISPLELILNTTYGYTLVFWTPNKFITCPVGTGTLETVARAVIDHLQYAGQLAEDWLMRDLQQLRTTSSRRFNARRKLRFFRSSVINTFKDAPTAPGAKQLMQRADALEQSIEKWSSAA